MKKFLSVLVFGLLAVPAMAFHSTGYPITWPATTLHGDIELTCRAVEDNNIQVCTSEDGLSMLALAFDDQMTVAEFVKAAEDRDRGVDRGENEPKPEIYIEDEGHFFCANHDHDPIRITKIQNGPGGDVKEEMLRIIEGKGVIILSRSYDPNPEHARDQAEKDKIIRDNNSPEELVLLELNADKEFLCKQGFTDIK